MSVIGQPNLRRWAGEGGGRGHQLCYVIIFSTVDDVNTLFYHIISYDIIFYLILSYSMKNGWPIADTSYFRIYENENRCKLSYYKFVSLPISVLCISL